MKNEETKNKLKNSIFKKYGHENIMKYYSENNMVVSPFGLECVKLKIKKLFKKSMAGIQCNQMIHLKKI